MADNRWIRRLLTAAQADTDRAARWLRLTVASEEEWLALYGRPTDVPVDDGVYTYKRTSMGLMLSYWPDDDARGPVFYCE